MHNNLINTFIKRKLIYQISDKKLLIKLCNKKIYFFCGFDVNTDSLHIGHLSLLFFCKRLADLGHIPIILLGGATTIIGDPSYQTMIRTNIDSNIINKNIKKISQQIYYILKKSFLLNNFKIINNFDWLSKIKLLDFLNKIGSFFSINQMIHKDIIKNRLNQLELGISYKEFSYNLLQSFDFAYLYQTYNVKLQIGGSDQWGNIISGINLIKKKYKKNVCGITLPLITNKQGKKISKSTNILNNIWLNFSKTNYYNFYQFWKNIDDQNICQYLRIFTFINDKNIDKLESVFLKNNNLKNKLQSLLANEVTKIIYGNKILKKIKILCKILFNTNIKFISNTQFEIIAKSKINNFYIKEQTFSLKKILLNSNLVNSNNKAHNLIINKSIFINGIIQSNPYYILTTIDKLYNKYTLLKKGKKYFILLIWI